eukprot:342273-Chlamydomonas_euryale.AAC.6
MRCSAGVAELHAHTVDARFCHDLGHAQSKEQDVDTKTVLLRTEGPFVSWIAPSNMVRPSRGLLAAVRGFNWERYEAWRHHPLLKVNKNNYFPGMGLGIALFIAVKSYESSTDTDDHHH